MYQIKTIHDKPEKVEKKMNEFLRENPNINIIDMRQSQGDSYIYMTLTILYEFR